MLDMKKEWKEFYDGKSHVKIVQVPSMNYLSIRGSGNPNEEKGDYQNAVSLLYGVSYTLKMSYKGEREIPNFQEYVVPPLEGFWWQEGIAGVDYEKKSQFQWISLISLPYFIREEDLVWAKEQLFNKKKEDASLVKWLTLEEGLCVQALHVGPYQEEPETVAKMNAFLQKEGYVHDFSEQRRHHEIYLSNPKICSPEKMKTIIRHPIKKEE